ncbi:acyl carrier protein [Nostoc sp.]|uniref:acyl carrier protein n=1 Tax=Nostoc sp. TaxID=1180 RepID=UPI002FFD2593
MEIQNIDVNQMPTISENNNADARKEAQEQPPTATKIQVWLVSYLAEQLEINSNEIDVTIPFERYGLDSSAAVSLSGDLEEWLGCEIDPTLLYDYPTIKALARHLAEELKVNV